MLKILNKNLNSRILEQLVNPEFEVNSDVFEAKGYEIDSGHILHIKYKRELIVLKECTDEYFYCSFKENHEELYSNELTKLQHILYEYFMLTVSFEEFCEKLLYHPDKRIEELDLSNYCIKSIDSDGNHIDISNYSNEDIHNKVEFHFYYNENTDYYGIFNKGNCYITKKKEIFEDALSQLS